MKRFLLSLSPVPDKNLQSPKLPHPLSAVRLNLPKNTLQWLALVGFLRCYPPGSGSGPFRRQAFTRPVRSASQLRSAFFPLLPARPHFSRHVPALGSRRYVSAPRIPGGCRPAPRLVPKQTTPNRGNKIRADFFFRLGAGPLNLSA
jgi:hypothetical protein